MLIGVCIFAHPPTLESFSLSRAHHRPQKSRTVCVIATQLSFGHVSSRRGCVPRRARAEQDGCKQPSYDWWNNGDSFHVMMQLSGAPRQEWNWYCSIGVLFPSPKMLFISTPRTGCSHGNDMISGNEHHNPDRPSTPTEPPVRFLPLNTPWMGIMETPYSPTFDSSSRNGPESAHARQVKSRDTVTVRPQYLVLPC